MVSVLIRRFSVIYWSLTLSSFPSRIVLPLLIRCRLFSILSLFTLFFSCCFWCSYSLAPVPGGVAPASPRPTVRMEPVVRLPLPGRTLVEIRRSRTVVIVAGDSCFLYGLFLQFWFGPIRSWLAVTLVTPSWERGGA